ncbi:LapA family protein [bacterium]|nr:LapA family protein [bacterium]
MDVVVNTPGTQCLDQFATNTFVEEDTSGISLALILGIAIPAGLVAAGLMTLGILYYLKKKRDAGKAVKKLEQLPDDSNETKQNLDPLAGDDIFDDGGFGDEMDAVMKQGDDMKNQLREKERLIKAREKELGDLVRKIKKMDGGAARLRSEGL